MCIHCKLIMSWSMLMSWSSSCLGAVHLVRTCPKLCSSPEGSHWTDAHGTANPISSSWRCEQGCSCCYYPAWTLHRYSEPWLAESRASICTELRPKSQLARSSCQTSQIRHSSKFCPAAGCRTLQHLLTTGKSQVLPVYNGLRISSYHKLSQGTESYCDELLSFLCIWGKLLLHQLSFFLLYFSEATDD